MRDYAGRVAVVTGGADGIGLALSTALSAAGMRVALLDVRGDAAEASAQAIGSGARGYRCDVTLETDLANAAEAIRRDLGQVAIMCANAGVGAGGGMLTARQTAIDWVFAVNVHGLIGSMRAFVPLMTETDLPRAVCITASSASLSSPTAPLTLYAGSKHATMGIAEAAAAELEAQGITTTILCPGLINTRIWDGARARPDHFGGPRHADEASGEHWRTYGMPVEWVGDVAVEAIAAGQRYCVPVEQVGIDAFEARTAAIRNGITAWANRDRNRWPDAA
jgi:NAD(P)-dependent dehydrogenase (short-subunit alcohol dehydrogenase family)